MLRKSEEGSAGIGRWLVGRGFSTVVESSGSALKTVLIGVFCLLEGNAGARMGFSTFRALLGRSSCEKIHFRSSQLQDPGRWPK